MRSVQQTPLQAGCSFHRLATWEGPTPALRLPSTSSLPGHPSLQGDPLSGWTLATLSPPPPPPARLRHSPPPQSFHPSRLSQPTRLKSHLRHATQRRYLFMEHLPGATFAEGAPTRPSLPGETPPPPAISCCSRGRWDCPAPAWAGRGGRLFSPPPAGVAAAPPRWVLSKHPFCSDSTARRRRR